MMMMSRRWLCDANWVPSSKPKQPIPSHTPCGRQRVLDVHAGQLCSWDRVVHGIQDRLKIRFNQAQFSPRIQSIKPVRRRVGKMKVQKTGRETKGRKERSYNVVLPAFSPSSSIISHRHHHQRNEELNSPLMFRVDPFRLTYSTFTNKTLLV